MYSGSLLNESAHCPITSPFKTLFSSRNVLGNEGSVETFGYILYCLLLGYKNQRDCYLLW